MNGFFDYFTTNSAGSGFTCFGFGHFVWLVVGTLLLIVLSRFYLRHPTKRHLTAALVTSTALVLELWRSGLLLYQGLYDTGRLPLHLCTMSVYLCFFHMLRPSRTLGQFLYAFSLPGAVSALLFPDWSAYPLWHFSSISAFTIHFLLVLYPLMLTLTGEIKPRVRELPRALLLMLCLAAPVYLINKLLDTNYMFLNWPLAGTPLMLFASLGRPAYLLVYPLLLALAWLVMYGVPVLKKGRK